MKDRLARADHVVIRFRPAVMHCDCNNQIDLSQIFHFDNNEGNIQNRLALQLVGQ